MPIKINKLHPKWTLENVFSDGQWCPVCGGENFSANVPAGDVYCSNCGATFTCRASDPDSGLIVDCHPLGYQTSDGLLDSKHPVEYRYIFPEVPDGIQFWQVLKDCNNGLRDRVRWYSLIPNKLCFTRNNGGPVGIELFYFSPGAVASIESEKTKKETGNYPRMKEVLDFAAQLNPNTGYFKREQCSKVFDDDGDWIHRCIPYLHEKPILTQNQIQGAHV